MNLYYFELNSMKLDHNRFKIIGILHFYSLLGTQDIQLDLEKHIFTTHLITDFDEIDDFAAFHTQTRLRVRLSQNFQKYFEECFAPLEERLFSFAQLRAEMLQNGALRPQIGLRIPKKSKCQNLTRWGFSSSGRPLSHEISNNDAYQNID